MRKIKVLMNAFVCCTLLTAVGCGNNQNETVNSQKAIQTTSTESKPKHNIVKTVSANAELAEIAYSLDELIETSDIIVKAKIVDTAPYVPDDTVIIYTCMTPEIIDVYKGEYNGIGALIAGGGYMKCKDYANAKEFQYPESPNPMDISQFTNEQLEEEVYFNWMNNYTPEIGDTIIFFGDEGENGTYQEKKLFSRSFPLPK